MKRYFKPKSNTIIVNIESLMQVQSPNGGDVDQEEKGDDFVKLQSFRIIDDTDDLSEEDY